MSKTIKSEKGSETPEVRNEYPARVYVRKNKKYSWQDHSTWAVSFNRSIVKGDFTKLNSAKAFAYDFARKVDSFV
jgi:hypothetical protein